MMLEDLRKAAELIERIHEQHKGCKSGHDWIEDYSAVAADASADLLTILERYYDEQEDRAVNS